MKDKGQVSIYVIVGILVVVIAAGAIFFANRPASEMMKNEETTSQNFAIDSQHFKQQYEHCMELALEKAIVYRQTFPSLENEEELNDYIKWRFYRCFENIPDQFRERGYDVTILHPSSIYPTIDSEINDKTILFSIDYPAYLKNKEGQETIAELASMTFDKTAYAYLNSGISEKDQLLVSPDGRVILDIPKGTHFEDYEGNSLESFSVEVEDKRLINDNPYIVGNNIYLFGDAITNNKITLTINYDDNLLPEGAEENNLRIARYDEERNLWVALVSEVDTEDNTVSVDVDHFSPYSVSYTRDEGNESEYDKFNVDFLFIEHLHRPCRDALPREIPESDPRYTGIYNKGDMEYEESPEWRWKLNNYCTDVEGGEPVEYNGDYEPPKDPVNCGSVYAQPQMYAYFLARDSEGAPESDNREFAYDLGDGDYLYASISELLDGVYRETTGDHGAETTSNIPAGSFIEDSPDSEWGTVIEISRPNEFADSDENIRDWDDDDQEKLSEKNCDGNSCLLCKEPITNELVPCDSITTIEGEADFSESCMQRCEQRAESVYKETFENFPPWNPTEQEGVIGDGILDFKWQSGRLVRNKLACDMDERDLEVYVTTCHSLDEEGNMIDFSPKDLATPMYYGYGGEITGDATDRIGQLYREIPPEHGYEGVGNNDYPVTGTLELSEYTSLCEECELYVSMNCTIGDKCVVVMTGLNGETVTREITTENIENEVAEADPDYGTTTVTRSWCIDGLLSYSEEEGIPIEAWIVNRRESDDVCAKLDVYADVRQCFIGEQGGGEEECTCETLYGCEFEEEYCEGENNYYERTVCSSETCPGHGDLTCTFDETCEDYIKNYCGDGIIQSPNDEGEYEECDDGNQIDGDGCDSDCKSENEYCGDGNIQDGEECGEPGLNCDSGWTCNEETCLCEYNPSGYCGNGIVECPNANGDCEICDDGNNNNNDECRNDCTPPQGGGDECCICHYNGNGKHVWTKCGPPGQGGSGGVSCDNPGHSTHECDISSEEYYGMSCPAYDANCDQNPNGIGIPPGCNQNCECEPKLGERAGSCQDCSPHEEWFEENCGPYTSVDPEDPEDPTNPGNSCGNGVCQNGESYDSCPKDCPEEPTEPVDPEPKPKPEPQEPKDKCDGVTCGACETCNSNNGNCKYQCNPGKEKCEGGSCVAK